jgi:predicted nucleic acid-binding protein
MALGRAPTLRARFAQVHVIAPDHLPLESANALAKYVRAELYDAWWAAARLRDVLALRIQFVPAAPLAPVALQVGLELGLSVYDAAYVVVAEAARATLVTADRRLAAAYPCAELIA